MAKGIHTYFTDEQLRELAARGGRFGTHLSVRDDPRRKVPWKLQVTTLFISIGNDERSIGDWTKDPRVSVTASAIKSRFIKSGWSAEDSLFTGKLGLKGHHSVLPDSDDVTAIKESMIELMEAWNKVQKIVH
jgi:hypothetical protein